MKEDEKNRARAGERRRIARARAGKKMLLSPSGSPGRFRDNRLGDSGVRHRGQSGAARAPLPGEPQQRHDDERAWRQEYQGAGAPLGYLPAGCCPRGIEHVSLRFCSMLARIRRGASSDRIVSHSRGGEHMPEVVPRGPPCVIGRGGRRTSLECAALQERAIVTLRLRSLLR